jgi:hypothetical protein
MQNGIITKQPTDNSHPRDHQSDVIQTRTITNIDEASREPTAVRLPGTGRIHPNIGPNQTGLDPTVADTRPVKPKCDSRGERV